MSASKMIIDLDDVSDEKDDMIMIMHIFSKKEMTKSFVHSCNRHAFMRSLTVDQQRLCTQYIP